MIAFHSDDYGINVNQALRILDCRKHGCLNSVSIMPNSAHLDKTIPLLDDGCKKNIHINLVEGPCCAAPSEIPLLVQSGVFCHSFGSLMLLSLRRRAELEHQVETECLAQIRRVTQFLGPDYKLRIDSHVHYHMIPAVFRALCRACAASGLEVEYIRYPTELLTAYLRTPSVWPYIRPVNLLKTLVLKILGIWNRSTLHKYNYQHKTGDFFGVMFTGKMSENCVIPILNAYEKHSKRHSLPLELLFHPGGIEPDEEFLTGSHNCDYYMSPDRKMEANTLKHLAR